METWQGGSVEKAAIDAHIANGGTDIYDIPRELQDLITVMERSSNADCTTVAGQEQQVDLSEAINNALTTLVEHFEAGLHTGMPEHFSNN